MKHRTVGRGDGAHVLPGLFGAPDQLADARIASASRLRLRLPCSSTFPTRPFSYIVVQPGCLVSPVSSVRSGRPHRRSIRPSVQTRTAV